MSRPPQRPPQPTATAKMGQQVQQNIQQAYGQPDPEPPKTIVIEASCKNAETRSADNATWTNKIDPILVKKGSQLRATTTFLDARGVDSEIMQFAQTGSEQDNSQTMLSRMWVTNDGLNNKSCSYDYMGRSPFRILNTGSGMVSGTYAITGGTGAAPSLSMTVNDGCLTDMNIAAGGSGYSNGDEIRWKNDDGDAVAYALVDSQGAIRSYVWKYYANGVPVQGKSLTASSTVTITSSSNGSGATITAVLKDGCLHDYTLIGSGVGYVRGESGINFAGAAGGGSDDGGLNIQISSTRADGSLYLHPIFDQGYNYQKAPLFRWSQSFECSDTFTYGRAYGDRVYTTESGKKYEIAELSSINKLDPCLSASYNIQNKEDEFASGIFHQGGTFKNFEMFKSMTVLNSDSPFDFKIGLDNTLFGGANRGIECTHVSKTEITDGKAVTILTNPLAQYPIGTVLYGYWRTKRPADLNPRPPDSDDQIAALSNEFINNFGGIYCVGENKLLTAASTPNFNEDTRAIIFGSPTRFDASGESDLGDFMNYDAFNAGVVSNLPLVNPSVNKHDTGYPSQTIRINTTYAADQSDGVQEGRGCVVEVETNANGEINFLNTVFNGGSEYNEGDVLTPNGAVDPVAYPDWVDGNSYFYVTRTDGQGGMNMMGHISTTKDQMSLPDGTPVEMILIPHPFYQQGIGKGSVDDINPGSWVFKKTVDDGSNGANYTFDGYENLPPLFQDPLQNSGSYGATGGDLDTDNIQCGLFRNAGEVSGGEKQTPGFVEGNNRQIAHDTTAELTLIDSRSLNDQNSNGIVQVDLILGTDPDTCHLSTATGTLPDQAFTLSVNRALMAGLLVGYSVEQICLLQGYFTFNVGGANGSVEEHMHLGGGGVTVTDTHINIRMAARNVHSLIHNGSVPTAAVATLLGLNHINGYSFQVAAPSHAAGTYRCQFWTNPLTVNNQIQLRQATQNSGTVAVGNTQNFFNTNDVNFELLPTLQPWKRALTNTLTTAELKTYDQGGCYYLTHAKGNIESGTTFQERINSKFFGFSQGMGEFILTENDIANQYVDGLFSVTKDDDPRAYQITKKSCNIEQIYDYEPVYVNKTFTIDRNFVVPSDIANYWNRESHALQGFIDRDTGEEILPLEENPLLQNEFLFPCYGSNSEISANGEYIENNIMFPYQGGYQGGHIIGINGIDADQEWLAGDICAHMPKTNNTHVTGSEQPDVDVSVYYIFFRTPWSLIRNYDPLKSTGASGQAIPDFTSLHTLSTTIGNIGNATSQTVPPVPPVSPVPPVIVTTVRLLDGTIMPNKTLDPKLVISELQDPTDATTTSTQDFPSSAVAYPVRCLKDNNTLKFARCLASQYVGSTNMTLAFDPALSSFNFQFFFSPYTSPFVDGEGGDISTRVFYGNRIKGIYNHDTLSGINAENWCRPTYPRNTFTQADVQNNTKYTDYPNGIDPKNAPDPIGLRFLNKLGFTNTDIGVDSQGIALIPTADTTNRGTNISKYDATFATEDANVGVKTTTITTVKFNFNGTQGAKLGSDDAVLSSIDAPENAAGLHSNNKQVIPASARTQTRTQKFGDYIYYPYSLNDSSDSFNTTSSSVRFDNATQTYGSIGGLRLSNMIRGMGLPNTTGSTVLTDDKSVPRTLNCDCNIYLSYTVQTASSKKLATNLPRKMEHGHLVILSSLIEEPNFYMSKLGFVNGMSVINKSYITGDFILSNGQLSWYAKEDRYISEITTSIVNTNGDHPTILGDNTTVIYEIIDFKPKPMERPTTIGEIQQQDYQIMDMLNHHLDATSQGQGSALTELESALYGLGISTMQEKSPDVVAAMRDKINALQLNKLTPAERAQYFATAEGQQFMQHAQDIQSLSGSVRRLEATHQDVVGGYGSSEAVKTFNQQREELAAAIRTTSDRIQQTGVIASSYVPTIPVEKQIPNLTDRAVRREVSPNAFSFAIVNRHRAYTQYSLERQSQGRHNIPFDQHQNFIYGDVLHPEGGQMPANLPRNIQADIGDPERYGLSMADDMQPRPVADPIHAAYAASPYLSSDVGSPEFAEELRQFKGDLDGGTAELTYLQEQILQSSGREYQRDPRTGFGVMRTIQPSSALNQVTSRRFPGVVFRSEGAMDEAHRRLDGLEDDGNEFDIEAHKHEVGHDNYQGIKTGGRPPRQQQVYQEIAPAPSEYLDIAQARGATKDEAPPSDSGVGTESQISGSTN